MFRAPLCVRPNLAVYPISLPPSAFQIGFDFDFSIVIIIVLKATERLARFHAAGSRFDAFAAGHRAVSPIHATRPQIRYNKGRRTTIYKLNDSKHLKC